ncbi:hypothetical protein BJ138DRAFT_1117052 [Hygrophoropsis aurantiaca]|uniref:Uncharacterized protein n=1 Tax=Hygrophoropsis aurantiaca TaxID=72124 RepID=A0ACB8A0W2_9AGAM|nr:hypothetical protein BJ138DRAFT_1117052 [Hygrophoropsis aurantiaca]
MRTPSLALSILSLSIFASASTETNRITTNTNNRTLATSGKTDTAIRNTTLVTNTTGDNCVGSAQPCQRSRDCCESYECAYITDEKRAICAVILPH